MPSSDHAHDTALEKEESVVFHVNDVLQTVNFNQEEIGKVAQELVQNDMKLSLNNGHHFRWKECYDKLLSSGERQVFACQIRHGKRANVYEDEDTQGKKDKQTRIIDVNRKGTQREKRRIIKENRRQSQTKKVHFTIPNLAGSDENEEQL